jgi:hypothetical protein
VFHACESNKGWEGVSDLVSSEDAPFVCQAGALAEVKKIKAYVEWVKGIGGVTCAGSAYDLHSSAFDEKTRDGLFFSTMNGTHNGAGGPVEPTGKSTASHCVCSSCQ